MNLTLDSSHSFELTPEAPAPSRRHRVSCGSLITTSSSTETSGTKIIRSCSSSFSHLSEIQKPSGSFRQQTCHGGLDTSVLASAFCAATTVGLSVSHSASGEPLKCDLSPTMTTSGNLPYILRSVSGERRDVRPGAPSEPNEYNFNFKRRGVFIIINNKSFDEETGQHYRDGSDVDAERLEERFQDLGFEVRRFDDLTCSKMTSLLQDVAQQDHSECDCFGCAILSHGRESLIYGRDGCVSLESLVQPFKADRCPTLMGKPKLFFIQACESRRQTVHLDKPSRGRTKTPSPTSNRRMSPVYSDHDKTEWPYGLHMRKIPIEADCLFCYSTVPGYFSWQDNQDGSWFIQALCIVLENYGSKMELMHLLTHVNRIVAYEFASCTDKEFIDIFKLMPCIASMLTRYVYFRPKKQDIR